MEFANKQEAEKAIQQLNGLKLVEKQLIAEFVKKKEDKKEEDKSENKKENEEYFRFLLFIWYRQKESTEQTEMQEQSQRRKRKIEPSPVSPKLGINYSFPPHLNYGYPQIDQNIVSNITNSIYINRFI